MYLNKSERSLLAQMRCGILPIRIETGRFSNIRDPVTHRFRKMNANERICQLCNSALVEDEIHFVCICPLYEDIRSDLYHNVSMKSENFQMLDDVNKFVYLLKNECKLLVKFLSTAWNIRKSNLYKM